MTKVISFLLLFFTIFVSSNCVLYVIRELIHDPKENIPLSGLMVSLVVLNIGTFWKEYKVYLFDFFK